MIELLWPRFDDVETTISVWQAFAETLHAAVRAADSFSSYEAGQAVTPLAFLQAEV